MKPTDVLAQQIEMVAEYIARHWSSAREEAQKVSFTEREISRILIGGCGDSHHAALGLELAFSVFAGFEVAAMEAMRLSRYAPLFAGQDPETCLVIGISNSGEVARTIEAIEVWRQAGAQTLAFTSDLESTLAQTAEYAFATPPVTLPHGPGLLSYIGALLIGYATAVYTLRGERHGHIQRLMEQIPDLLSRWVPGELQRAEQFAERVPDGIAVFVGSGSARGSAHFSAAKVIEAAGERCWAQDVEEWAHLEYFCDPPSMPTILLGSQGRSYSRETEVWHAMSRIGRSMLRSEWRGGKEWSLLEREVLAPLALWAAPCAYACTRAALLSAEPFRGFQGGRDVREGGGVSRIRSSQRIHPDDYHRMGERAPEP